MEKLRRLVSEIAYAHNPAKLSPVHRFLIPFLYFSSSLYKFALSLRHCLYHVGFFAKHRWVIPLVVLLCLVAGKREKGKLIYCFLFARLPVPVVSVGNLTWGGNGKTPMVEFIAMWLADCGLSPLILSRVFPFLSVSIILLLWISLVFRFWIIPNFQCLKVFFFF